jgi:hypothetical protein
MIHSEPWLEFLTEVIQRSAIYLVARLNVQLPDQSENPLLSVEIGITGSRRGN